MAYMYDEIQFTRFTLVDGDYVPMTGLETGNLVKFKKVVSTTTEVPYTVITYQGGGAYTVGGFCEADGVTPLEELTAVYIEIDGTIEYEYGISYVGSPDKTFLRRDGTFAMKAALDLGTYKVVNLGTPTANTDATTKYYVDLAIVTLGTTLNTAIAALACGVAVLATGNTFSGLNTFTQRTVFYVDTGVSPAIYPQISTYEAPVSDTHLAPKKYVDDRFAATVGVVQSDRKIKLIENLTATAYSRPTLESCVTYMNANYGLTSKYRGVIVIEMGSASGTYASGNELVATGSTWFDDYIDIVAESRIKINIGNSGNSLTSDTILQNVHLYDVSEKATQAFTGWTFINVTFDNTYADYTFTTCKFINCLAKGLSTISFVDCKGLGFVTNCTVTQSGTGRVHNVFQEVALDDLF